MERCGRENDRSDSEWRECSVSGHFSRLTLGLPLGFPHPSRSSQFAWQFLVLTVHQVQTGGKNHDCRETDRSPGGQNGEYSGEPRQDEANGPGELRDANKGNDSMLIGKSGCGGGKLIEGEKLHGT